MSTETQRLDELAARLRETPLSADEQAELDALLLRCPEARRRFVDHMLLQNDLNGDAAALLSGPVTVSVRPRSASWLSWRPLTAAAPGIVLGMFCTSMLFAYVAPTFRKVMTLLHESFESGPAPLATGVPIEAGQWSGDYSEVEGEQQGVKSATGTQMLRFLSADYEGKPNPGGYSEDLFRLIDVRSYRREFSDGGAVVQLSAVFNAVALSADEKDECDVCIYALDADMATNGSMRIENKLFTGSLAMARSGGKMLDRDATTWQRMACELRLPTNTDFLMIRLGIVRSSHTSGSFVGHYADDVRVTMARRAPLP